MIATRIEAKSDINKYSLILELLVNVTENKTLVIISLFLHIYTSSQTCWEVSKSYSSGGKKLLPKKPGPFRL